MHWLIGAVAAAILMVLLLDRPVRQWRKFSLAAMQARKRKDWTAAANAYRDALEAVGRLKEPSRSKLQAETQVELAGVLHRQGRLKDANEMFRKGYSKLVIDCWRARLIACQGYLYWGDLATDEGSYGDAEEHYRLAVKSCESIGNTAAIVFALQRLADSLIRQRRRGEAEDVIRRAIALESQGVSQTHAGNPAASLSVPDLYFCREDYDQARRLYREKVDFWERQRARPENVDVGYLQMRLAVAEARTGHYASALEMWEHAASTLAQEWGEGHPKVSAARLAKAAIPELATV
jgi:tetratricopeptide (TPR) repeat protein